MKSPEMVQAEIIEAFNEREDAFDQFDCLLAMAAELDELAESDKVSTALVEGCQSQVWLYLAWEGSQPGSRLFLKGDSDTLMVRGVIRILELMFSSRSADQILSCPVLFVEQTELKYIFDAKRQAGVASIVQRIRTFAEDAVACA